MTIDEINKLAISDAEIPQEAIKELCEERHLQLCHICKDFKCCDNLNPDRMKEDEP